MGFIVKGDRKLYLGCFECFLLVKGLVDLGFVEFDVGFGFIGKVKMSDI